MLFRNVLWKSYRIDSGVIKYASLRQREVAGGFNRATRIVSFDGYFNAVL